MAALCVLEMFYRLPSWKKGGREEGGGVGGMGTGRPNTAFGP